MHQFETPFFLAYRWPAGSRRPEDDQSVLAYLHEWLTGCFRDVREVAYSGPLIELRAKDCEQARGEAAEHWLKRTGFNQSSEPPIGYVVWDRVGRCIDIYCVNRVN